MVHLKLYHIKSILKWEYINSGQVWFFFKCKLLLNLPISQFFVILNNYMCKVNNIVMNKISFMLPSWYIWYIDVLCKSAKGISFLYFPIYFVFCFEFVGINFFMVQEFSISMVSRSYIMVLIYLKVTKNFYLV